MGDSKWNMLSLTVRKARKNRIWGAYAFDLTNPRRTRRRTHPVQNDRAMFHEMFA